MLFTCSFHIICFKNIKSDRRMGTTTHHIQLVKNKQNKTVNYQLLKMTHMPLGT